MMGACFCSGPRPGHTLCPCAERRESDRSRREIEMFQRGFELGQRQHDRSRLPLRDRITIHND